MRLRRAQVRCSSGVPSAATSLDFSIALSRDSKSTRFLRQCVEIRRRHHRVGLGNLLVVGVLARIEHAVVGGQTLSRQSSRFLLMNLSSR